MKLCTKFEASSFTGFWDIVEGMPNFLGVTWPKQRPLSEILYIRLVGQAKLKLCTNLELSGFTDFGDIIEGMPKILGVTWPRPRPLSQMLYFISVGGAKVKLCTKFEDDLTIQERVMTFLVLIRYVTLWPWPLTFWPWTVIMEFLVMRSNHTPTLSMLRRSKLELWYPQSGCYWQLDYVPLRMHSIAWPVYKGLTLPTFLKSLTPICLFTLQLIWRYDEV